MKILGFLKQKFLKIFIDLVGGANHEKKDSKGIIALPKIFLRCSKYHNFFIFNRL